MTYSCCVRCVWSDIYDMILVYSAAPELSETRRSLLRRWMDGLCGWLAKPLFVTWGAKREGNGGIKDRSIALCPVRHSFPFLPFSCRASQRPTSGKHKQQGWLVTYCLVSCSPRLFQKAPTGCAGLDCTALYFTSSGPVSPTGQCPSGPSSWLSAYSGDDPWTGRSGGGHAISESGLQ